MNLHMSRAGILAARSLALLLGTSVLLADEAVADDYGFAPPNHGAIYPVVPNPGVAYPVAPNQVSSYPCDPNQAAAYQKAKKGLHDQGNASVGTLGYGPPGLFPGFQGFGLGYHLGYGYGGDALGVGAEGGYPFYGGPGYPHPEPVLRRFGGIVPFAHFAGPGYPTPDHPNYYGGIGGLVPDRPVVTIATEAGVLIDAASYGPFTGGVADPEAQFAPFTARAAAGAARMEQGPSNPNMTPMAPVPPNPVPTIPPPGAGSGASAPPAASVSATSSVLVRALGIEEDPVVAANGARGVKIANVFAGAAAEKAGLHAGDVIYSGNGYLTQTRGNLTWIINHAAPTRVLTMRVSSATDGKEHTITAELR
jgi:PDZ domain